MRPLESSLIKRFYRLRDTRSRQRKNHFVFPPLFLLDFFRFNFMSKFCSFSFGSVSKRVTRYLSKTLNTYLKLFWTQTENTLYFLIKKTNCERTPSVQTIRFRVSYRGIWRDSWDPRIPGDKENELSFLLNCRSVCLSILLETVYSVGLPPSTWH